MSKTLKSISLLDLLPQSLKTDTNVVAASRVIESMFQNVAGHIDECLLLPRLDKLPESVLDLLAWQWHVDFYEPLGLSIDKKRELIRKSIAWHRHKGTPWAVEQVVTAAVADATISEWFEYGGEPGMFRIETSGFKGENTFKNLIAAINSAKNTRSHLDRIIINANKNKYEDESMLKYNIGLINMNIGKKRISLPPPAKTVINMSTGIAQLRIGRKRIHTPPPPATKINLYAGIYTVRTGRIMIGGTK